MFINVGLGLILDLCPCKTALKRLGWWELGGRKLLAAFWPASGQGKGREQTSDGAERSGGREGPSGCSRSHEAWGGGAREGSESVADQPAKIGTRSTVATERTSFCRWFEV